MKKLLKPASILFYLLCLPVFFIIGVYFAGLIDAGEGQGLAGGAIVLGWGVLFAGIAFIASFFVVYHIPHKKVILMNWILFILLLIGYGITHYRFKMREKKDKEPIDSKKVTSPAATKTMAMLNYKDAIEVSGQTQATMGMGYFSPNYFENPILYFYGNLNLEKSIREHMPYDSITFSRNKYGSFEIATAPPWLVPDHLKLDYDLLYFKIESITQDFIEVVVNTQNGQTSYVDRSAGNIVYWPEFLLNVHSVEFLPGSGDKVRARPFKNASFSNSPYEFMHPLRIKGEWMEVVLMDHGFKKTGKGWIQWKREGKLLVMYNLLS